MNVDDFYKGKDVLVTGGCGSIGREIVRELLNFEVKRVRVFDQNEFGHHLLKDELKNHSNVDFVVGNVRDPDSLRSSVRGVDFVFHAAALKHVPFCETDPMEAVKTNLIGTNNLIELSKEESVKKFIFISTDKTNYPTSAMAATKLLCEKLVLNTRLFNSNTKFSCVRFGNVLKSDGSVIPLFIEQLKRGYITLTDERMSRFFMSIKDSVNLVLKSAMEAEGGEIFVLKMKSLMIKDLAECIVDVFSPVFGINPESIKIKYIGIRPGEKLHERLMIDEEIMYAQELNDRFVIKHNGMPNINNNIDKSLYVSEYNNKMSKEEIKHLLNELNLLD